MFLFSMINKGKIKSFKWTREKYLLIILFLIAMVLVQFFESKFYINPTSLSDSSYKTSWIGNTFGGGNKWVQNQIKGLYVASDGTCYTNSIWDEAGREAGIYKDGDVIDKAEKLHGWGRNGGVAVTANDKYLYIAMQESHSGKPGEDYPPKRVTWYAVRRYDLSGKPAPFTNGRGFDKSMLIINTSDRITGLTVSDNELYVSDPGANQIHVYDPDSLEKIRDWSFKNPSAITIDSDNNLWIVRRPKNTTITPKILKYSKDGVFLQSRITDIIDPTALAIDNQNRLLVAENGSRQQILIYDIQRRKPRLVDKLGVKFGIYAGKTGKTGNLKLNGITGVGVDSDGNIYVSNDGFGNTGTDLRKYSSTGKLKWQLLGLEFVDNADVDPATDGNNVFTKQEHFVMDYNQETGQEWTYKSYTVDKFSYPDDPRLHNNNHSSASVFIRRINNQRFMFMTGMFANHLSVFRFDGEIAVPSAIFARSHSKWPENQPNDGSWLWRDLNGDGAIQDNEYQDLGKADNSIWGWEIDSNGDVWQASEKGYVKHYLFQGLDSYGSPIYDSMASETIEMPAPFTRLERIKYFPDTDVMYLTGYTTDNPKIGKEWGIVGTEIIRYDNWSSDKNLKWRIILPYEPESKLIIKAVDIAGDRVFAVESRSAEVQVYDAITGEFIMTLSPGSEVSNESGWVDIPYGLRAYQRQNGEYLVFVEENAKAKVLLYKIATSNIFFSD
ncbi:MAG: hypothetical protein QNJ70_19080 [Xenococcaceae cyanobacterium MO_207.B15]|nr:hypothetical protein [Xenococcaceae cyanobacterium MO_207.B15]